VRLQPAPSLLCPAQHEHDVHFGAGGEADRSRSEHYSPPSNTDSDRWITFVLREAGNCEGLRCVAHFEDGTTERGVFDGNNMVRFSRATGDACTRVELVFDDAVRTSGSVAESLLSVILG
jgi:hypothetical protein